MVKNLVIMDDEVYIASLRSLDMIMEMNIFIFEEAINQFFN